MRKASVAVAKKRPTSDEEGGDAQDRRMRHQEVVPGRPGARSDRRCLGGCPCHAVASGPCAAARILSPTMSRTRSSRSVSSIRRSATFRPSYMTSDPVADAEQVLEAVGDEDDRDAALLDPADQAQHGLDLGDREGRGRLVHDEHRAARRRRRGRSRSTGAGRPRAGRPAPRGWGCGSRASPASRAPRRIAACREGAGPGPPDRLAAEEQVAGDVDRVAEREVLVDHLDPAARAPRPGWRSAPAGPRSRSCRRPAGRRRRGSW